MKQTIINCGVGVLLMIIVFTPIKNVEASWREDMESLLQNLIIQVEELQQQLLHTETALPDTDDVADKCTFLWQRDLAKGDRGVDVQRLQFFLNHHSEKTRVSVWGYGSPNNETQYFGTATANAVERFKDMYDIEEEAFGLLTRTKVMSFCDVAPEPELNIAEYTVDDVVVITATEKGNEEIDTGYTLYTISLTDGSSREVEVYSRNAFEIVVRAFSESGYIGDVNVLLAKAVKIDVP